MLEKIIQLFKIPELRRKIFIIFGLLVVFRLLATIPLPDVDIAKLKTFFEANQIFGLFNIFTGGALSNLSIAMLGIAPYITASIIIQLLTMIFPGLKEMLHGGDEAERKKFEQYARLLTLPLAFLQSFALLNLLRAQGIILIDSHFDFLLNIILVTTSTIFIMWLGELITEQKLGNGISLIIFTGIVIDLPRQMMQTIVLLDPTRIHVFLAFLATAVLIIISVVFITRGQRKIPVSYARQVRGTRIYGGANTYLPMRVNQAGVIPIIFALSLLMFPSLIGQMLSVVKNETLLNIANFFKGFNENSLFYSPIYFILVFLFAFFYTSITFEPKSIAENLQKHGGFIPGYRPGQVTADYLLKISQRITLFGAIFLGIIAILPIIMQRITGITTFIVGGTSLLIMVEVAIETMNAVEAQLIMREYETF